MATTCAPPRAAPAARGRDAEPADNERCCWICLGDDEAESPLVQPCSCPRFTHRACLAHWQLVSAGKE
jgi:E3 ubiquitin-protein ligase DOA10